VDRRNAVLYTLNAVCNGEVIPVKVGFRKVEIKNAQLLVNGQPVLIKAQTGMKWIPTEDM
jgi:beta-galactosidase/beta-glucuronidase